MSHLIQSISDQLTDSELEHYQANVKTISAQECAHLIMIAFDEMTAN